MVKIQEKENVLRIFEEAKWALEKKDSFKLNLLSNQTINTASRTQDPDNIATAVVIYSLGKIIERGEYSNIPELNRFKKKILKAIEEIIKSIKNNNEKRFQTNIQKIQKEVGNLSGNLKNYIQDVFRKASINKASRIYEHGISMETTAKLLGITLWELASYSGQKQSLTESSENKTISAKQRIKLAMEMFE